MTKINYWNEYFDKLSMVHSNALHNRRRESLRQKIAKVDDVSKKVLLHHTATHAIYMN